VAARGSSSDLVSGDLSHLRPGNHRAGSTLEELLIFRKFRRIQFRIHELTQEHLISFDHRFSVARNVWALGRWRYNGRSLLRGCSSSFNRKFLG
jgi:hypothetical protein